MKIIEKYGLKKEDWHYYGQWVQPPLGGCFWIRSHGPFWKKLGLPDVDKKILEINGYFFVYQKEWDTIKNFTKDICKKEDKSFIENFKKVSLQIFEEAKEVEIEIEKNEKSKEELFDIFVNYNRKIMAPWYSTCLLSDFTGEIIKEEAIKHNQDFNEILDRIPIKETIMLKQNKDILKIKRKIKEKGLSNEEVRKDDEIWREIQEHIKEYEWIGTHHFWGDPYNVDKFFEDMLYLKEQENVEKDILDSFKFITNLASEFGFIRQYAAEIFDILAYKVKSLLEEIAKEF